MLYLLSFALIVVINRRHLEVAKNYSQISRVAIPQIKWRHIGTVAGLQFIQIWREFDWNISPLRAWLSFYFSLFSLAHIGETSFPIRCVFRARIRVTTPTWYISIGRCLRMSPTATCTTAHGSHNIPCVSTHSRYAILFMKMLSETN